MKGAWPLKGVTWVFHFTALKVAALCFGIECCGIVWYGMALYSMAQLGMLGNG